MTAVLLKPEDKQIHESFSSILSAVNEFLNLSEPITFDEAFNHKEFFIRVIRGLLAEQKLPITGMRKPVGRIIGYGALGKVATWLLPELKGSFLEPTELWDLRADGVRVRKPDFASLCDTDILIIFPRGVISDELDNNIIASGCTVLDMWDAALQLAPIKFPQLREYYRS